MGKIDIDKLVASVYKHEVQKLSSGGQWSTTLWTLDEVLREQGLKYKAGEIVRIEPNLSNLEQNGKDSKENIVPKFKKGDLVKVQYPSGIHTSIEGELCRVVDVQDEHYIVKAPDGNKYQEPMSYQDYWTNIMSSKPANFAKSSKDLQELTEFEKAVQSVLYTEITNAINNDPYVVTVDKIKQASKMLLDKARKYYNEKSIDDMLQWGLLD